MNDSLYISQADIVDNAAAMLFDAPVAATPKVAHVIVPPEVVTGRPGAEYHADIDSVGCGALRDVARSPLHHWWAHRRPGREQAEPTPSQRLGTAIHAAVLEPERFATDFMVRPDCDRRTKEGKAIYAEFMEMLGDRQEITVADQETALRIAERVRSSKLWHLFSSDGYQTEVSAYWTDKATGVRCRMRPDAVPAKQLFLIDLKSCSNADDTKFRNSAWDFGYHVSAAWYVDGWRAATGEKRDYIFAAFEKEEPHACAWFYADDELLEAGRVEYRRLLKIYAKCLAADEWPGYPDELQPLFCPPWAMDKG